MHETVNKEIGLLDKGKRADGLKPEIIRHGEASHSILHMNPALSAVERRRRL
jgi:hypothetical protein